MANTEFERIAIVNRGEPAMRLIHAVREYNFEHGTRIRTIALFTEPDCHAMFVREADEAHDLGPANSIDSRDGQSKSTYVNYPLLQKALLDCGADAVWPGWGFVAEHAAFVDLCDDMGITFIGPSGDVMRKLGDKISSKHVATEADVPVAPWSEGPVDTVDHALEQAHRLGYPLMLKATAGGGGRGIRKVTDDSTLRLAFESAGTEALKAFGDGTMFLEKMVTGARHVEVQIIADGQGTTWALGVRDCTLQRRNQKVIEETPSPCLTEDQQARLCEASRRLSNTMGYKNAGTVEFLYEPASESFSFMEVNARLQVEHPVTELVTGVDLVKLQLHVARGGRLQGDPPTLSGHCIEARLCAEDPEDGFAPSPGAIDFLRLPKGPGIRVDIGVEEGDIIPSDFDSMIGKIIAHGRDRTEAMARLRRAVGNSAAVIRGGTTNKGFLLQLLGRPEVTKGEYDVGWLDRLVADGGHIDRRHAEIALLQASIDAYQTELAAERTAFLAAAARGRPEVSDDLGRSVELGYRGNSYKLHVRRVGPTQYRVGVEDRSVDVQLERLGKLEQRLTCLGRPYRVLCVVHGVTNIVEVDGIPHRVSRDRGGVVRSPSPAVVVSVEVSEGDEVQEGDRLAVLEAMKMEIAIEARFAGTVREILVLNNVQVPPGAPLMMIEPSGEEGEKASGERLSFDHLQRRAVDDEPLDAYQSRLRDLSSLLRGFDVAGEDLGDLISLMRSVDLHSLTPARLHETLRREDEVLLMFAEICALFKRQREDESVEQLRLSTKEYFFHYLHDISSRGDGLPADFVSKLTRALHHYGIRELDPSPELEECLFRIYRSQRRADDQVSSIIAILQRRCDGHEHLAPHMGREFAALIDRLIRESEGRFQAVNDYARELRYRYYGQAVLEASIKRAYADVDEHLALLSSDLGDEERAARINSLAECPQPLKGYLARRWATATPDLQAAMLETLLRRYYQNRELEDVCVQHIDGRVFASARYAFMGRTIRLFATNIEHHDLESTAKAMLPLLAEVPDDEDLACDFYTSMPAGEASADQLSDEQAALFAKVGFPRPICRIITGISELNGNERHADVLQFTFRPEGEGYAEQKVYRGLHPLIGKRLHLWRLGNFDLKRLPSIEDVYLFRAVAKDNAKDVRLFALAEVRDLTPLLSSKGRVIGQPLLERMFLECVTSIRTYQADLDARGRLHWNRILLFVRPTLTMGPDELNTVVQRLAPATIGLGLERVVVQARVPAEQGALDKSPRDVVIEIANPTGTGISVRYREPSTDPMFPLDEYTQKVVSLRRRELIYPYEIVKRLASDPTTEPVDSEIPPGTFTEYDLDETGALVSIQRPPGQNRANIVVGVVSNRTDAHPEGIERVILLGDPSKSMGSLAEAECRRINAAIDLAEDKDIPLEWYAVSAGARISMDSGTENMDWIAAVLRRLVLFTQGGGEVNIVVCGVNVGAQPYWNAEATMLMHTKGILIMLPSSAMVLTGKKALDYSGGVSADDNEGIGGFDRIMGPNGQAQYFARDMDDAIQVLLKHYEYTYVHPGERFGRTQETDDPRDRDVRIFPHGGDFETVGDVFSQEHNPGRKRPFEIRRVMRAVSDQDFEPMERWFAMRDAENAVVWEARLGGRAVSLLGIESHSMRRLGPVPADGPENWTAGTLFPQASRKVARAINAASGNRPLVVLANLSGFDGSPESLRNWQLEYGAEIGRAIVNFDGPIVFTVISRYHGGAFVVFSNRLNDNMETAALDGAYASVIGGAPAAAVVFARDVIQRTKQDPRVKEVERLMDRVRGSKGLKLRDKRTQIWNAVHSEKLGEVAEEFDHVHSVQRAEKVKSVDRIVPVAGLRPYLIDAVERGVGKALART